MDLFVAQGSASNDRRVRNVRRPLHGAADPRGAEDHEGRGHQDRVLQGLPFRSDGLSSIADDVVAAKAQVVVLGSVDVPTVQAFMQAFEQAHYSPKAFIATAGPDQGSAFIKVVGKSNADGVMVPNAWYGLAANAASKAMVAEYIAKYGGTPAGVNSDVAEAYAVGQVVADAVKATGGFNNAKIISYLHSGVTLSTVLGSAKFNALGENPR